MNQCCIFEGCQYNKFQVRFSEIIGKQISVIYNYNQDNINALSQWYEYLDGIVNYISNPSIAWDYANQHIRYPNGTRFIRAFNYNVGYAIKTNSHGAYVYVFKIDLKPQEFGLKVPPTLEESKQIIPNTITPRKRVVRLTESELRGMIVESIKRVLNETCQDIYRRRHSEII